MNAVEICSYGSSHTKSNLDYPSLVKMAMKSSPTGLPIGLCAVITVSCIPFMPHEAATAHTMTASPGAVLEAAPAASGVGEGDVPSATFTAPSAVRDNTVLSVPACRRGKGLTCAVRCCYTTYRTLLVCA